MNRFSTRLKTRTGIVATIAALVVGLIFCRLGLWQLDRADEKRAILTQHKTAMQQPPLTALQVGEVGKQLYRQVSLRGTFDQQHQFLIDNRIVNGQAGFEVVTPFYLDDDTYVLINRGWVGQTGDRKVTITPDPALFGEITIKGILTTPSKGFILGDSQAESLADSQAVPGQDKWPLILQFTDYETIAVKLDKIPVLEAVVIAAQDQPGLYRYNWKPVASGIEKHLGYAFQWFAMLAALIVLYLYLMVFKKHNE